MFLIVISYIKSLDEIENHVNEHLKFLDTCYENNFFIFSGPKKTITKKTINGGVIFSGLKSRVQLEEILKKDPLIFRKLAKYEIIEFEPTKWLCCVQFCCDVSDLGN